MIRRRLRRVRPFEVLVLPVLLALLVSPFVSQADAHRPGISYARVEPAAVTLTFARPELAALGPMDDVAAAVPVILAGTLDRTHVSVGGAPCGLSVPAVRTVEGDGVEIRATLDCPTGDERSFTAEYLDAMADGHRVYLDASGSAVAVLDRGNASATFKQAGGSVWDVAVQWVGLGVEHIWTGYDHLAFLAALLLVATSLRQMLLIVTGFTVAHSITLCLSATGVFVLSPEVTEPAIAFTIFLVGVENLLHPTQRRRIATTFILGLIHGFGFAGALREVGIPQNALAVSLGSFNLGVELGQSTVAAVILPVLLVLRRRPAWVARAVPALSVAIALLGAWLFVQRVWLSG